MEGGFFDELRQLDFFPGAEKQPHSCVPVVSSTAQFCNSDPTNQGIYQDEESVDFSALLEPYNPASSCNISAIASTVITATNSPANSTITVYQNIASPDSNFDSFQGFLSPSLTPPNMYASESFVPHLHENHMSPNSPSSVVVDHSPKQHVVQIDNISVGGEYMTNQDHPAPGKSPRSKSSKKSVDKRSDEYRHKRDRNNVAVRKSREKSKIRVIGTEKRVKELEEENSQLQYKITLLTKELTVLKNLFTSAGVTQPPNSSAMDRGVGRK